MKKVKLMVAIFAIGANGISLRANAQEGIHIGVQGTPHMSWLMNKDDTDNKQFKSIATFNGAGGINFEYGIASDYGVGLHAMYSMQGQRYKFDGIEYNRKVDYIKIPVFVFYTYEMNSTVSFIGKIGPQLGLLVSAKLTDKDGNALVSDQKTAYENFDVGGFAMAGFGFKLTDNFYLDALLQYDYAFTNAESTSYHANINHPVLVNGNGGTTALNASRAKTYNMTAGLCIGLRYNIK